MGLNVWQDNAETLEKCGKYDVIFNSDLIEHLKNPKKAFKVWREYADNLVVCVSTNPHEEGHLSIYNRETLFKDLKDSGWIGELEEYKPYEGQELPWLIGRFKKIPSVSLCATGLRRDDELLFNEYWGKQKYPYLELVFHQGGRISEGLNKCIKKATGDIIIFTETDVKPIDEYVVKKWVENYRGGICKARELHPWSVENLAMTGGERKIFKNQFDKSYEWSGDTEFFLRLKKGGIRFHFLDEPIVIHERAGQFKKLWRAYQYGREFVRLYRKYNFYPIEKYKQRHEISKKTAEAYLKGIKDELNNNSVQE